MSVVEIREWLSGVKREGLVFFKLFARMPDAFVLWLCEIARDLRALSGKPVDLKLEAWIKRLRAKMNQPL